MSIAIYPQRLSERAASLQSLSQQHNGLTQDVVRLFSSRVAVFMPQASIPTFGTLLTAPAKSAAEVKKSLDAFVHYLNSVAEAYSLTEQTLFATAQELPRRH